MAIGERIRFFRNLKGMTQKYLGMQVGFPEKTADIRMAQYESGSRTPKADLTNNLANVFGISTSALTVPDIDSYNGLMHTLFTLEDLYGFRIGKLDDELCIRLDKGMGTNYLTMFDMFSTWQEHEGIVRELVSKVQNLRKVKDFDVADRITLYYYGDIDSIISEFADYIKKETLSVDIVKKEDLSENFNLNGIDVKLDVEKVTQ